MPQTDKLTTGLDRVLSDRLWVGYELCFDVRTFLVRSFSDEKQLEMSGNLTAVTEMSGNLLKIREMSGKYLVREKLPKSCLL